MTPYTLRQGNRGQEVARLQGLTMRIKRFNDALAAGW